MLRLQAIRVKNLRSLADTDFIELKPITLLVGKNSSGKSTFARIFPLLRQSAEAVRRTPLLWYGRLTDFGTISDARRRDARSEGIEFTYRIAFSAIDLANSVHLMDRPFFYGNFYGETFEDDFIRAATENVGSMDVAVEVRPNENGETVAKRIGINIYGTRIDIELDEKKLIESIKVNETRIAIPSNVMTVLDQGQLIPQVALYVRDEASDRPKFFRRKDYFFEQLITHIYRLLVHGNTTYEKIYELISQISLGNDQDVLKAIKTARAPKSWRSNVKAMSIESREFSVLRDRLFAAFIPILLRKANDVLTAQMRSVKYLEPLRATAQRFYRRQELAVNEIDSRGENMAMFLDSLNWSEKLNFQQWCKDQLGFRVEAAREGGHVSIRIQPEGDSVATNLADTGFGFSQFLPIAAQIWSSSFRENHTSRHRSKDGDVCLVIEQPELHLHPAFQARLGDLFALACANSKENSGLSSIVAETHSQQLVHRLGTLISQGKVKRDDVQVVLFERMGNNENAAVRIAEFDDDGVLMNWPFGFLEAEA